MGGSIRIQSEPGSGATFLVELTLDVAAEPTDGWPEAAARNAQTVLSTFPHARVLVAEDQPSGRNVLRRQLAKLQIEPKIVNDGQQAYDAYLSEPFDLLITDCHMPNVNGFELTRMIRRRERGHAARLPILAFTANAMKGEAEFCLAAGMDAYIVKPASLAMLSQKVGELLDARPAQNGVEHAASASASAGAIDYRALATLAGEDDPEELRSIALEFLASARPAVLRARGAVESRDATKLAEASHAGRGSALNVCAAPLAWAWSALESDARRGDFAGAAAHVDDLEERLAELEAAVAANPIGVV
jgi:CheY-like chemotaxis protein/HPt (histidine-containing phosphotransfer) domain-containing protein